MSGLGRHLFVFRPLCACKSLFFKKKTFVSLSHYLCIFEQETSLCFVEYIVSVCVTISVTLLLPARTQTGTSTMTGWWKRWNAARWIRWLLFSVRKASSPPSWMLKDALRKCTRKYTDPELRTLSVTASRHYFIYLLFLSWVFLVRLSGTAELHKFQTLCWSDIPECFPAKT